VQAAPPAQPSEPPAAPAAPEAPPAPSVQATPPPVQESPPPAPPMQESPPPAPPAAYSGQEMTVSQGGTTELQASGPIDWNTMTPAQIAQALGYEGLNFEQFGVTPIVSLDGQEFKCNDGRSFGPEFFCFAHTSRPKFVYKPSLASNDHRWKTLDTKIAFSYDRQTTNGKDLNQILNSWQEQGITHTVIQYLEITCVLDSGEVVLLSVPPTSIGRFTSFFQNVVLSRRKPLAQVRCRVGTGALVTKAVQEFYPMSFDIAE